MFPRRTTLFGSDGMDKKTGIFFLLHPRLLNLINTSSQKCDANNLLTTPNVKKKTYISTDGVLQVFKNTSTIRYLLHEKAIF